MARPKGPISAKFAKTIIEYTTRPADSKRKHDISDHARRMMQYEIYKAAHKPSNRNEYGFTELTYYTLPEFLRISGMSMRDAYSANSVVVPWPSDKFKQFADMLEKVPARELPKIVKAAEAFAPDAWTDETLVNERPTYRACYYLRHTVMRKDRFANMPESFAAAWADKKCYTMIPTEDLPAVSKFLGVSLHWLVCPNDYDMHMYASQDESERALDAFCFMSERQQDILMNSVAAMITRNGGAKK